MHVPPAKKRLFLESHYFYSKVWEIINYILLLPVVLFSGNRWPPKNWTGLEIGCNSVNPREGDDIPYMRLLFVHCCLTAAEGCVQPSETLKSR